MRLRLVWTALALAGLTFVALDVAALRSARGGTAETCAQLGIGDPYEVAARFLTGAVERRDPASAYMLATPSLRAAGSCSDWARGRLPVAKFRPIDWSRASYQEVAGGEGQVVLRVLLYRAGETLPAPFLMEIQTELREPGWHVGYFAPDRWYEASLRSPAA